MKFFSSDLHLAHQKICQYTNRHKFTTHEAHTDWIRQIWNSSVKPGDIVYHLGDLYFGKHYEPIAEFLSSVNGQKILIKGNHDRQQQLDRLLADGHIVAWYDYKQIHLADKTLVCLFHYPITIWNERHCNSIHLHGHSHGSFTTDGKILDVGLDSAYNILGEHRFFNEHDITTYVASRTNIALDYHKERKSITPP